LVSIENLIELEIGNTNFIHGEKCNMKFISRSLVSTLVLAGLSSQLVAQEFVAGEPIGSVNEAGVRVPMSSNVKVYGSFHFSESCTFDPNKNLVLAMNNATRGDGTENDGYVTH